MLCSLNDLASIPKKPTVPNKECIFKEVYSNYCLLPPRVSLCFQQGDHMKYLRRLFLSKSLVEVSNLLPESRLTTTPINDQSFLMTLTLPRGQGEAQFLYNAKMRHYIGVIIKRSGEPAKELPFLPFDLFLSEAQASCPGFMDAHRLVQQEYDLAHGEPSQESWSS